jgi:hypothetical protein
MLSGSFRRRIPAAFFDAPLAVSRRRCHNIVPDTGSLPLLPPAHPPRVRRLFSRNREARQPATARTARCRPTWRRSPRRHTSGTPCRRPIPSGARRVPSATRHSAERSAEFGKRTSTPTGRARFGASCVVIASTSPAAPSSGSWPVWGRAA